MSEEFKNDVNQNVNEEVQKNVYEKPKKEPKKISLSVVLLILSVIVLIVMGVVIFMLNKDKKSEDKKITDLQTQVNNLMGSTSVTDNNTIQNNNTQNNNTQNNNTQNNSTQNNNTQSTDVTYEFSIRDIAYVTVKATKNGKTVSQEFEEETIDQTGTMEINTIGKVALVSAGGGEASWVSVYQLVNDKIIKLGEINFAMPVARNATYTATKKSEGVASITSSFDGKIVTKEFEMGAGIARIDIVDFFNFGKVVLVAESGGESYGITAYRLILEYPNGAIKGIEQVGTIDGKYIFPTV